MSIEPPLPAVSRPSNRMTTRCPVSWIQRAASLNSLVSGSSASSYCCQLRIDFPLMPCPAPSAKVKSTGSGSPAPSNAWSAKRPVGIDPVQEEMRRPGVGIGRGAAVAMLDPAIGDGIADPHRQRGARLGPEIVGEQILRPGSPSRADLERPGDVVAIIEGQRQAVLAGRRGRGGRGRCRLAGRCGNNRRSGPACWPVIASIAGVSPHRKAFIGG